MSTPISPAASAVAERSAQWAPGRVEAYRHQEIFAPADEAGGVAAAIAFAADHLRASPPGAESEVRPWLWVQDRAAQRLGGRPYAPGLPRRLRHRLIHVAAKQPKDALFALEEGLRCRDLAFVIGEIAGNPRALDFTASRRLSLAAERHGVPLWLVRLGAARDLGSARMRWEVRSAASRLPEWNPQAPGAPSWRAELFRARHYQPGEWVLREEGERLLLEVPSPADEDRYSFASQRAPMR